MKIEYKHFLKETFFFLTFFYSFNNRFSSSSWAFFFCFVFGTSFFGQTYLPTLHYFIASRLLPCDCYCRTFSSPSVRVGSLTTKQANLFRCRVHDNNLNSTRRLMFKLISRLKSPSTRWVRSMISRILATSDSVKLSDFLLKSISGLS